MPTRDERLDALLKATEDWSHTRLQEVDDQVRALKKILKDRGIDQAAKNAVQASSALLVDEINDFLSS